MHSYSPSNITYNIRVMIIFFIWNLFIMISLIYGFSSSIFIFLWIFVLFVLPSFRNNNTIIPKIITHSITIIIFQFYIMLILIFWYNTFHSQSHSFSSTILILLNILIINILLLRYI